MTSRRGRAPLRVGALGDEEKEDYEIPDPFADIQLSRILKELSFIRISIDDVTMSVPNTFLQKLNVSRQLYGFQLEYSFPCLEVVSKALRATVRIPEKAATMTSIEFRHKRVVLLSMHEDQIAHWQRAKLNLHLLVQMEAGGKFTTRPLAKCSIPLYELLVAPYMICRDFDFVGPDFEGTSLIRIDLGSRGKPLMEKLEALRDRSLETTFTVTQRDKSVPTKTRSRSSSRCRSHQSSRNEDNTENLMPMRKSADQIQMDGERRREFEERVSPDDGNNLYMSRPYSASASTRSSTSTPLFNLNSNHSNENRQRHLAVGSGGREGRTASTSSIGSDSVFNSDHARTRNDNSARRGIAREEYSGSGRLMQSDNAPRRPADTWNPLPSPNYAGSSSCASEEVPYYGGKCHLQLTIHGATGLPPIRDESGRIVSPNPFVSVRGREGELRSEVCESSRQPRWNWTAQFAMSSERRNLVVKVLHRGACGDKPLGFVTLTLPIVSTRRAVFEMTDISQMTAYTSEVPMLEMTIEKVREVDSDDTGNDSSSRRSNSSRGSNSRWVADQSYQSSPIIPNYESPRIFESREDIMARLRKNVAELDTMMRGIRLD